MAAPEEQFLSLEDVAARLQVSDQTVRRWIKSGKLAAYKPGLEYRIRRADLEEFLRAREVRPKVPRRSPSEPSFNDVLAEERRRAFIERCKGYIEVRVAYYKKQLAEAERGGFFAGYEGAKALNNVVVEEFVQLSEMFNEEMRERWLQDPEVPENVKTDLGFALAEIWEPMARVVGGIGGREAELAETEAQRQETERRREEIRQLTRHIA